MKSRIYLKLVDDLCYKVSPLMLSSTQKEIDTTHLTHLDRIGGFISDSSPGNFGNVNTYPTIRTNFFYR